MPGRPRRPQRPSAASAQSAVVMLKPQAPDCTLRQAVSFGSAANVVLDGHGAGDAARRAIRERLREGPGDHSGRCAPDTLLRAFFLRTTAGSSERRTRMPVAFANRSSIDKRKARSRLSLTRRFHSLLRGGDSVDVPRGFCGFPRSDCSLKEPAPYDTMARYRTKPRLGTPNESAELPLGLSA